MSRFLVMGKKKAAKQKGPSKTQPSNLANGTTVGTAAIPNPSTVLKPHLSDVYAGAPRTSFGLQNCPYLCFLLKMTHPWEFH